MFARGRKKLKTSFLTNFREEKGNNLLAIVLIKEKEINE